MKYTSNLVEVSGIEPLTSACIEQGITAPLLRGEGNWEKLSLHAPVEGRALSCCDALMGHIPFWLKVRDHLEHKLEGPLSPNILYLSINGSVVVVYSYILSHQMYLKFCPTAAFHSTVSQTKSF